jgi:hypothetical protein
MRKTIAGMIIAAAVATSACGRDRGSDAGPTVSRNYQVGNFQEVEVAGPFDVTIRTGANPGVQAKGSEKLIERLVVEVKDAKLLIHPEKHKSWFNWGGSHGKTDVTITVPALRSATLAGAGDMRIDKATGDSFEAKIAGAGDLHIGTVQVGNLKVAIAGSGDADLGSGKASLADYTIAGAGEINAKALASDNLKISIAGSGNVQAHATGTADVSIMGSGDVDITGGAKCKVSKAGSGDVRCS